MGILTRISPTVTEAAGVLQSCDLCSKVIYASKPPDAVWGLYTVFRRNEITPT